MQQQQAAPSAAVQHNRHQELVGEALPAARRLEVTNVAPGHKGEGAATQQAGASAAAVVHIIARVAPQVSAPQVDTLQHHAAHACGETSRAAQPAASNTRRSVRQSGSRPGNTANPPGHTTRVRSLCVAAGGGEGEGGAGEGRGRGGGGRLEGRRMGGGGRERL